MTTAVEQRFLADPASTFRDLDGHHLASLAFAFHAQRGGSAAFWAAVSARAAQIGEFAACDHANLSAALGGAASGAVPLPAGVTSVPDEK